MTNKIFLIKQRKINKYFHKYKKEFISVMKNNPNLSSFKITLDNNVAKLLINFSNSLIYFYANEKDIDVSSNKLFKVNYFNLLKSIVLLILSLENNYKINIFNYDFEVKQNTYSINNNFEINSKYFEEIKNSSNEIYSFIYYLYKIEEFKIEFTQFYELMLNIIKLAVIRKDFYDDKYYFFRMIKIKKRNYSEQKTNEYLKIFKNVRIQMQDLFKIFFNDLIFVLNNQ